MLDKFMSWVKDTSSSLKTEVQKFRNKDFLEATIAACTVVSAADGSISAEEKQKMIGFIKQNEALNIFDINEAIKLFEKYASNFAFDSTIGKAECYKVIAQLKKRPDEARLLIRVCSVVGAADGNFDDQEKQVVRDICAELGQNPADFNL